MKIVTTQGKEKMGLGEGSNSRQMVRASGEGGRMTGGGGELPEQEGGIRRKHSNIFEYKKQEGDKWGSCMEVIGRKEDSEAL